ncbi:MAG: tetratricopeptide repeat protein, partial [Candidatus Binatia bacterium]
MKRWLACLLLLTGCGPQPGSLPSPAGPSAQAAAIPEGRTPEERREIFKAALSLYDQGDQSGAERLFAVVATVYPELADYGLRHVARIAAGRGDSATALANWQALVARHPDSVWSGEAELALGRASAEAGDWDAASRWLAAARRDLTDAKERATALGLSVQAARARGDEGEARALATELRSRYGYSREAAAAREDAWAARETAALATAEAAIAEIALRLLEGDAGRALELARAADERFSAHPNRPEILRLQAAALLKSGETEEGARLLERIRSAYPRHPAAAQAIYRLASIAWNRDDDEEALRLFNLYARLHPRGTQAAETIYAIARIHQEAGRYEP